MAHRGRKARGPELMYYFTMGVDIPKRFRDDLTGWHNWYVRACETLIEGARNLVTGRGQLRDNFTLYLADGWSREIRPGATPERLVGDFVMIDWFEALDRPGGAHSRELVPYRIEGPRDVDDDTGAPDPT